VPLGALGFSSFQHRRTPEVVLQKSHASFRITFRPRPGAEDRGKHRLKGYPQSADVDGPASGFASGLEAASEFGGGKWLGVAGNRFGAATAAGVARAGRHAGVCVRT
jgi:hypothetical protein